MGPQHFLGGQVVLSHLLEMRMMMKDRDWPIPTIGDDNDDSDDDDDDDGNTMIQ